MDLDEMLKTPHGKATTVAADTVAADEWDGYIAEFIKIDGTKYSASDFGEFKNEVWVPKTSLSLTYGGHKLDRKPLGHKSYGHIAHLQGSRIGPGDHKCHEGQKDIACLKTRDKYDRVIVQEKLDGSNVGVARIDDEIIALSRSGYLADSSPFLIHHFFDAWVKKNRGRFVNVLQNGERICGEWLLVAHGTRYELPHEPFVVFDLMRNKHNRVPFDEFLSRIVLGEFVTPTILSDGPPVSIERALSLLGDFGYHGAIEKAEGVVWRVERSRLLDRNKGNSGGRQPIVDFLVKYVRPDKKDGKYLKEQAIYNQHTQPTNR